MLSKHGADYEMLFNLTGGSLTIVNLSTQSSDFEYFNEQVSQTAGTKSSLMQMQQNMLPIRKLRNYLKR